MGARFRQELNDAFLEVRIRGHMTGVGSSGTIQWTDAPIVNSHQEAVALRAAGELPRLIDPACSQCAVSTPMGTAQVEQAVWVCVDALRELKPLVADVAPQLLK